MAETKTKITVCGKEYNIVSPDSREHVHRVALYLDDKIKVLRDENLDLTGQMLLTLAALNVADEYIKAKDRLESAAHEVEALRDMAREMQIKRQVETNAAESTASERIKRLEEENAQLKQQLDGRLRRASDYR